MALATTQVLATLKRGGRHPRVTLVAWREKARADGLTDPGVCAQVIGLVDRELERRDRSKGKLGGFRGENRLLLGRSVYWIP